MTTAAARVLSDVDLLTIIAKKVRIVETADRSGCWDQASLLRVFRFALTCRAASMAVAVAAREWRILLATRVVPFAAAICYGAAATAGGGALVLVGCAMDMFKGPSGSSGQVIRRASGFPMRRHGVLRHSCRIAHRRFAELI